MKILDILNSKEFGQQFTLAGINRYKSKFIPGGGEPLNMVANKEFNAWLEALSYIKKHLKLEL